MSRLTILSSFVAVGHVGLSAGQPVCQRLGVDVTAIPTVVLSNHPGWPIVTGYPVDAERMLAMVNAIRSNGWLAKQDALLIGYMPTVSHVEAAVTIVDIARETTPGMRIVVDPILGDAPRGLYIAEEIAARVRDALLPLADAVTPNLFELEWLAGRACPNPKDAKRAARQLGVDEVYVTSAPSDEGQTGVLSVDAAGSQLFCSLEYADVPNGIGDVFAAMVAANLPIGQAVGHVHALARISRGRDHLNIIGGAETWQSAPPIEGSRLD